jgi:hypothetical protein
MCCVLVQVLRDQIALLSAAAPNLEWLGYLSSTGVYGDWGGDWVDEQWVAVPAMSDGLSAHVMRRWRVVPVLCQPAWFRFLMGDGCIKVIPPQRPCTRSVCPAQVLHCACSVLAAAARRRCCSMQAWPHVHLASQVSYAPMQVGAQALQRQGPCAP